MGFMDRVFGEYLEGRQVPHPFPKENMTNFLLEGPWSLYIPVPEATGPRAVPGGLNWGGDPQPCL